MNMRSVSLPVQFPLLEGKAYPATIGRLQELLTSMKGVQEVSVNNACDTIQLVYDPDQTSLTLLQSRAKALNITIAPLLARATFFLEDVASPEIIRCIESDLSQLEGVLWVGADYTLAQVHVEYLRDQVQTPELARHIRRNGVIARSPDETRLSAPESAEGLSNLLRDALDRAVPPPLRRHLDVWLGLLLALLAFPAGWLLPSGVGGPASRWLCGLALVISGWKPALAIFASFRTHRVAASSPVILAVVAALALDRKEEATLALALYRLGTALPWMLLSRIRMAARTHSVSPLDQVSLEGSLNAAVGRLGPIARRAERIAFHFPGWMFWLAVVVALAAPLLFPKDQKNIGSLWELHVLPLLMIAGSEVFLLAVSTVAAAALTAAANRSFLLRNGAVLEALKEIGAVVYTKTGIVTEGRPYVVEIVTLNNESWPEIISKAAALEQGARHPVAVAIVEEARRRAFKSAIQVSAIQDRYDSGRLGMLGNAPTLIGSLRLFQHEGVPLDPAVEAELVEVQRRGKIAVLLGNRFGLWAVILLQDPLRSSLRDLTQAIQEEGVTHQAVISGGAALDWQTIQELEVQESIGDLLPSEIRSYLRELQERFGGVVLVSDARTHADALSAADVGVAIRPKPGEPVPETADVIGENLTDLPALLRIGWTAHRVMRQNLALAALGVLLLSAAAILAALPIWLAALLTGALSLLLCWNASYLLIVSDAEAEEEAEATQLETPPIEEGVEPGQALLELVFIHDSRADEQPVPGFAYPEWESFVVPFTGKPIAFGRKFPGSTLPIQIVDEGVSRYHGEFLMDGRQPVVIDRRSTNGIRRNSFSVNALVQPEQPIPLHVGDFLCIGRNTRIEIRRAGATVSLSAAQPENAPRNGQGTDESAPDAPDPRALR
jgi:cation transport ATPase